MIDGNGHRRREPVYTWKNCQGFGRGEGEGERYCCRKENRGNYRKPSVLLWLQILITCMGPH